MAHTYVTNAFEPLIGESYYEAIERLSEDEQIHLLVMAAQAGHTYWCDWILGKLVEAADPRALKSFERWAHPPDAATIMRHEDTGCFALAMQGCALFRDTPPDLFDPANLDEIAWQAYGRIIFWLYRPGLTIAEVRDRCAPIWAHLQLEASYAAIDPLYQLAHVYRFHGNDEMDWLNRIVRLFPKELRALFEQSLAHPERVTTIYRYTDTDELTKYMIDGLGSVGTSETADMLLIYVEHPTFGQHAIAAIQRITDRS